MNTQEVFQHAKDDMLTESKHAPVLYVEFIDKEGKSALAYFYFASFGGETDTEEHRQFFDLGLQFGEEHAPVQFTCLTFISEAWTSRVPFGEKKKFRRPEDDPNRGEGLMAQIVEIMPTPGGKQQRKPSFLSAEILRPSPGVVDLVEENNSDIELPFMLFPDYFLSGYIASQTPPAEMAKLLNRIRQ